MKYETTSKLIIGLTGGIGSGKTAASEEFEKLGIVVVDADVIAREVVEPGRPALQEIENHFGSKILNSDGCLNRATLRNIVFSTDSERVWLETLLHPIIRKEIEHQLSNADSTYAMLVSPLLFETNQSDLADRTLLIDVPVHLQLERASKRDQNSIDQIQKIVDKQMPREEKLELADDIIENNEDLAHLIKQVKQQHELYLELASEQNRQIPT